MPIRDQLLQEAALKIMAEMPAESKEENSQFDPITILMIISVIISFIRMIQECRKNTSKETKDMVYNLDDDNDRAMKKEVRRLLGWRNYRHYGKDLVKAMLIFTKEEADDKLEALLCLDA